MDKKIIYFFRNLIKWIIIFPTIFSCFISGRYYSLGLLSIIMSVFSNVFILKNIISKGMRPERDAKKKISYNIKQNLAYNHVIFYANFFFWLVDIIKI
ncbi:hypothetical protein C1646_716623, partial [Rhizophagus diaphanus]